MSEKHHEKDKPALKQKASKSVKTINPDLLEHIKSRQTKNVK